MAETLAAIGLFEADEWGRSPVMAGTHQGSLQLVTDGAARGNPGPAAIAFIVMDEEGTEQARCGKYVGRATNNVAEYLALIEGLKACRELTQGSISCLSDSELMVNQLNGSYQVKAASLKPLFEQAKHLAAGFADVMFAHRPREDAKIAIVDRIVNATLDRRREPDRP